MESTDRGSIPDVFRDLSSIHETGCSSLVLYLPCDVSEVALHRDDQKIGDTGNLKEYITGPKICHRLHYIKLYLSTKENNDILYLYENINVILDLIKQR